MTFSPTDTITMSDLKEGAGMPHLHVENRNIYELETMNPELLMLKDKAGETALHYAATNDDVEVCKMLIQRNPALLNVKDIEKKTAYDLVVSYNEEYKSHTNIIEFLKIYYN